MIDAERLLRRVADEMRPAQIPDGTGDKVTRCWGCGAEWHATESHAAGCLWRAVVDWVASSESVGARPLADLSPHDREYLRAVSRAHQLAPEESFADEETLLTDCLDNAIERVVDSDHEDALREELQHETSKALHAKGLL